jgi:hypothetical protein
MMLSARRLLALTAPQTRSFSAPKKAKVNFAVDSVVGKGPYVMAGMGVAYCMMGLVSGAPKAAASSEDSAAATAVAAAATIADVAGAPAAAAADFAELRGRLDGIDMRNRVLNHDVKHLETRVATAEYDLGLNK